MALLKDLNILFPNIPNSPSQISTEVELSQAGLLPSSAPSVGMGMDLAEEVVARNTCPQDSIKALALDLALAVAVVATGNLLVPTVVAGMTVAGVGADRAQADNIRAPMSWHSQHKNHLTKSLPDVHKSAALCAL